MKKQIRFENRTGESLTGTYHIPEEPFSRGVVLGHCFTCSRHTGILRQLAEDLNLAGFAALRFDFSGNGQSEGAFFESTYSKQISEMRTAVELLRSDGADWVGLAGHSLGAAVSVLTASVSTDIGAVCAMAGRISGINPRSFLSAVQIQELDRTGRVRFDSRGRALELTGTFFSDAESYDIPRVVGKMDTPILVVHGDADDIVPVKEAYLARESNPEKVTLDIVPGADHMFSDPESRRRISSRVVDWFVRIHGGQDPE